MSTLTPPRLGTPDISTLVISEDAVATRGASMLDVAVSPGFHSTQDLLPLFECPVCYEYILPPISQCTQGHLICSSCKSKVRYQFI